MRKFLQRLKENNLLLDAANVALGVVMLASLAFVFTTQSNLALLLAIWSAGLMNATNGLKAMKQKGRKGMGQSMFFMGILVIAIGTMLVFSMMGGSPS